MSRLPSPRVPALQSGTVPADSESQCPPEEAWNKLQMASQKLAAQRADLERLSQLLQEEVAATVLGSTAEPYSTGAAGSRAEAASLQVSEPVPGLLHSNAAAATREVASMPSAASLPAELLHERQPWELPDPRTLQFAHLKEDISSLMTGGTITPDVPKRRVANSPCVNDSGASQEVDRLQQQTNSYQPAPCESHDVSQDSVNQAAVMACSQVVSEVRAAIAALKPIHGSPCSTRGNTPSKATSQAAREIPSIPSSARAATPSEGRCCAWASEGAPLSARQASPPVNLEAARKVHAALHQSLFDGGVPPGTHVPTTPAARATALRRTRELLRCGNSEDRCEMQVPCQLFRESSDHDYIALAGLVWQLVGGTSGDGVSTGLVTRGGA